MKIKLRKAFICGLKGTKLTLKEYNFIKKNKPWGIILFERNIRNLQQISKLTKSIKQIFNDPYYPILIDEEGGRVSRLKSIVDNSIFSNSFFGNLYKKNPKKFHLYYKVYIDQISYVLNLIGANINTVPVLDLRRKFSHNVIGDRAFSFNKKHVKKIGDVTINLFKMNRIGTVIKHIPGHGLSKMDTHLNLPKIKKKLSYLKKNDFSIFKKKKSMFAMTAHIIFEALDKDYCVTHSRTGIKYIRNKIGFKNLIITDDISMKALPYSFSKNVKYAYNSGCNLVLHCNGKMSEMIKIAKIAPMINSFIVKKTSEFYKFLR